MQEDFRMADEDKILTGILTKERLKPLLPFWKIMRLQI